ncbi:ephrin type-A receptor 4-A-like isoform X1 [Hydra vulgaris]|uniref:ephrin type-A receptor 4-A-like isoform X1 n=1 Tax=Hydra vulgaris TaxID=6087 RepID=UPI001F5E593B|nr:ephrin type-A receptor 4-A-like isoform X1 [Hydra vulgaris]
MKNIFWLYKYIAWNICTAVNTEKYYITDTDDVSILSKQWAFSKLNSSYTCAGAWQWVDKTREWKTCLKASTTMLQNCILISTTYNVTGTNTVFIEINFSTTLCQSLRSPSCNEYLTFSAYIGTNVSEVILNNTIQSNNLTDVSNKFNTFYDTKGIENMKLAFTTSDYCGILKNVSLYAYWCPSTIKELAYFPKVAAPSIKNSPQKVQGTCIENSISNVAPYIECYFNGSYKTNVECKCKKGFEFKENSCQVCGPNYFKNDDANVPCQACGANSVFNLITSCVCLTGYYRIFGEVNNSAAACYKPPSPPKNITIQNITEQSAFIEWLLPEDSPFQGYFYIECLNCSIQDNFPKNTTQNQIILDKLDSFTEYNLTISYINNISQLTGKYEKYAFSFQTKFSAPGLIRDITVKYNSDGSIILTWMPPLKNNGGNISYKVKKNDVVFVTSNTYFEINSALFDKTYIIEIMCFVGTSNDIQIAGPIFKETITVKGTLKLSALIGGICGAFAIILIILLIFFIIWKKFHQIPTEVVRLEDGTVKSNYHVINGEKIYVDPTTYNKVEDAVQKFAIEIDRKNIKSGKLLGSGEFADVYKGTLIKDGKNITVAIKRLKSNASKNDRDDFFGEAAILGQFNDQNVVHLYGVLLKDSPNEIVLEFMVNGALDKFLQTNDMQFTTLQLLGMARGVASGMKYLSEMKFIHRDLAARNILVNEDYCCKVADFGMSRKINIDDTYETKGGKIPVRWTAPECVQYKKFTSASDMWSYGVLLWEIVSYGERPYWDWGNYLVLERINSGYRLPPPMGCPKIIHNLMLRCWEKDHLMRPKFSEVVSLLENWIKNPELLKEEDSSTVNKSDGSLDYSTLKTVNQWLEAIGMEKYDQNFLEKDFFTLKQVIMSIIIEEDLLDLGIRPVGHRKKIFKSIETIRNQIEKNV